MTGSGSRRQGTRRRGEGTRWERGRVRRGESGGGGEGWVRGAEGGAGAVEADNLIRTSGIGENSRRPFLVEVNWSLITDLLGSSEKD